CYPPLDVYQDPALRVAQVVTTLQQGGAERIALDLARGLGRYGVRSLLVALGRPTRAAFPAPAGTLDLSGVPPRRRTPPLADVLRPGAVDVVHAHLLDRDDVRHLTGQGMPVVVTVHNMRLGWPRGLDELRPGDASLLAACARAVEDELRAHGVALPVR